MIGFTTNRPRRHSSANVHPRARPAILSALTPQTSPRNAPAVRQSLYSPAGPSPQLLQSKLIDPSAATKSPWCSRHRHASPTAISCLGAFRSPTASERPYSRHGGDRKPAQERTKLLVSIKLVWSPKPELPDGQ